ncbi:MAG: hypothetical protein AAF787_19785, partial [Chloroflexota bacterium]
MKRNHPTTTDIAIVAGGFLTVCLLAFGLFMVMFRPERDDSIAIEPVDTQVFVLATGTPLTPDAEPEAATITLFIPQDHAQALEDSRINNSENRRRIVYNGRVPNMRGRTQFSVGTNNTLLAQFVQETGVDETENRWWEKTTSLCDSGALLADDCIYLDDNALTEFLLQYGWWWARVAEADITACQVPEPFNLFLLEPMRSPDVEEPVKSRLQSVPECVGNVTFTDAGFNGVPPGLASEFPGGVPESVLETSAAGADTTADAADAAAEEAAAAADAAAAEEAAAAGDAAAADTTGTDTTGTDTTGTDTTGTDTTGTDTTGTDTTGTDTTGTDTTTS